MSKGHILYLSTGSNIGNRKDNLARAYQLIQDRIGTVIRQSSLYETEAWGIQNQRVFFNQILYIHTKLSVEEVLECMKDIESEMGRIREDKWKERIIDIDILFYDDLIYESPDLTVPHPHLHNRNFILVPFLEIAPEYVHPKLNQSMRELYFACSDPLKVYLN
ncbi:MAG: 2-amino-4-hydroxy-6-hydroxymethyldihydropteridine diphosphokinase [Bacteroidia bacterium]|nr:2-amino-4-hydroxy-6-hydroxymethyldihydropteridine diphosphokinase [Bacteroidia bacterium]